ncbi:hypothetical protein EV421DRAFT_1912371 [Armillaria borealis]|uniref:Uncharacterized protein n=1 Tax=Armillaria borealis TaxID=47425 RepID=A0AA39IW77_9AGAR|nr:hypothetical protein EV421DRAFT_1912371 [Armillaria borealis]
MEEKIHAAQAAINAQMASVDKVSTTEQGAPPLPCRATSRSSQMSVDSPSSSPSLLSSCQSSDESSLEDNPVNSLSDLSSLPVPCPKPPPGVAIENVVVPMMLYTDLTHLTNFGDALLWPGYIFYGLLSKYISAMPDAHAAHYFVYMPELPDIIQDLYKAEFGELASDAILTHLKQELMQAVWQLLLDEKFKDAYRHGLVNVDGMPEDHGDLSLPSVPSHEDNHPTRWRIEEACKKIFLKGQAINSAHVEAFLKEESLIPTWSTFSEFFQELDIDFNFYVLFVIDLMHEFELGVFKDASALKQMAACDFKDLLQCALPCFEGLLPSATDNKTIQDLLFILGTWHGFAKLWMHTDTTIKIFGGVMKEAGCLLCHFSNTVCCNFKTEETPTEAAAHVRFFQDNKDDLAMQGFVVNLKNHILMWMRPKLYESATELTIADRQDLIIVGEHLYEHKVLQINYTSYDVRHEQDTVNPRTDSDVMMLTPEEEHDTHPYWYARVIGIYYVLVCDKSNYEDTGSSKQIDFLWVQWYGTISTGQDSG